LLSAAIETAIGPILLIAFKLNNYDQRVRREGYDIELLMSAAGMQTAANSLMKSKSNETPVTL